MSDETVTATRGTDLAVEKQRPAHLFQPGRSGNPKGRPKGSRSRFSEQFVQDIASVWEARGIEVLAKCATEEPGTFLRVCASLMPRDLNLSVGVNAESVLGNFRAAVAALGNTPPSALPRPMKVINGKQ